MASSPDFASPLSPLNLSPNSFPTHYNETTCYYTILGLTKTSRPSQDEIKKSYKKMALRFHPDKNAHESAEVRGAAEKLFKLVSRAYEVLSNPKMKELYDSTGHKGINAMNGQEEDADILRQSQRFGGSTRRAGGGGGASFESMFGPGSPHARAHAQAFAGFADPFDIFQSVFGAMHAHHHSANLASSLRSGGGGGHRGMHDFPSSPMSPFASGSPFVGMGFAGSRQHSSAFDAYDVDGDSNKAPNGRRTHGGGGGPTPHASPVPDMEASGRRSHHSSAASSPSYGSGGGHRNAGAGASSAHAQAHANARARHGHDPFFGGMGGMDPFAGMMGMGSMMARHQQMMEGMGMGMGMGGSSVMSSSMRSGGGGGGFTSTSTSSTTRIIDGQRVTRTVRRTTDAAGNTHEDVSEHSEPLAIGQGQGHGQGQGRMHLGW